MIAKWIFVQHGSLETARVWRRFHGSLHCRYLCSFPSINWSNNDNAVNHEIESRVAQDFERAMIKACAAQLLARLVHYVTSTLELQNNAIHCWTDSTIVLATIRQPPVRWKTFVANRVASIQKLTSYSNLAARANVRYSGSDMKIFSPYYKGLNISFNLIYHLFVI